jgi:hypothetical protein
MALSPGPTRRLACRLTSASPPSPSTRATPASPMPLTAGQAFSFAASTAAPPGPNWRLSAGLLSATSAVGELYTTVEAGRRSSMRARASTASCAAWTRARPGRVSTPVSPATPAASANWPPTPVISTPAPTTVSIASPRAPWCGRRSPHFPIRASSTASGRGRCSVRRNNLLALCQRRRRRLEPGCRRADHGLLRYRRFGPPVGARHRKWPVGGGRRRLGAGGRRWRRLRCAVYALANTARAPRTIYAGTADAWVLRSDDEGLTFASVSAMPPLDVRAALATATPTPTFTPTPHRHADANQHRHAD